MKSHAATVDKLVKMIDLEDASNLLFYGPVGFPIHHMIDYLLREIFGPCTKQIATFAGDMEYTHTSHYFEFDFHHPNFGKNCTECIDALKQIIQSHAYDQRRHVVVLKNVDAALNQNRQMFRVLLERYSKNAVFICTTHSLSAIEAPLQSRFMLVRVPLLTEKDVFSILNELGYTLPDSVPISRNLLKMLLIVDIIQNQPSSDIQMLCTLHYPPLSQLDFVNPNNNSMEMLRTITNKICQTNISYKNIILDLLELVEPRRKHAFLMIATDIEHDAVATNSSRRMFYIERLLYHALFE